jgi:energy-coupling factor transporter ATP-binding protein EcfA2
VLDEIVFGMENLCYSKKQMDEKLIEVTQILDIEHLLAEETRH